ncbi:MAG: hypothetical protein E7390_01140 [Ruminococcaceae bacterium]|nr:hypothetical protein [Oscillospiraceae bacterium]
MKKFRKILAAMLAAVSVMTMAGMPCLAWGEENLLPGGSFEEHVYPEGKTVEEIVSGGKLNNDSWYCGFGEAGYCKIMQETDGNVVELGRGTGGVGTVTTYPFGITRGATYRLSYDICNMHAKTKSMTLSLIAYKGTDPANDGAGGTHQFYAFKNFPSSTYRHMEHYFSVPSGRSDVTHIGFSFSIGNTSTAFRIKNVMLTRCTDPVAAFEGSIEESFTSCQWSTDPKYGNFNAHTVVSDAGPVFAAGKATTVCQTLPEIAQEGDAEYTAVIAQYASDNRLIGINIINTSSAAINEKDTHRYLTPSSWTIDADASFYKVFYRSADGTLLSPLAGKAVYTGTITPAS